MTTGTDNYISGTRSRTERRYWRRTDTPGSWWPWGLLPLLGLVLLFLYGALRTAPHIQSEVESEVAARLAVGAVTLADIDADGQGVSLRATAPASQETWIHALAKSAQCDTWLGPLTCPTKVALALDAPQVASSPPAPAQPVTAAPAPVAVAARAHDFTFTIAAKAITLRGEVPSEAQRRRIVQLASEGDFEVIDRLTVSKDKATVQHSLAADRALVVVKGFQRGQATWTAGVFDASGLVNASADADAARQRFNAAARRPRLGRIEVQVAEDVRRCNEDFRQALAESTIRFGTASAAINRGNETLLERLAKLADQCPGALTIEGHTDSEGGTEMNQNLSLGRAAAVRDALVALGVNAERLDARGYGESRPIADNGTAAGRARNRRIVITIDELN